MYQIFMDLLFALMYGVLIWGIRTIVTKVVPFVEAKLAETNYGWAAEIVRNAVRAYEQTVTGSKRGEEKFELVMDFINRELSKLGIKLSEQQITVLIESAVQEMNAAKSPHQQIGVALEDCGPVYYKDDPANYVEPAEESEATDSDIENIVACEDLSGEEIDKFRPRPRQKRVTNNSKGVTVRKE